MQKIPLAIASLALGYAFPVCAHPSTGASEVTSIRISYADLNLSDRGAVATLESRVRSAAETLCLTPGVTDLARTLAERKCFSSAVDGGRRQIEKAIASRATVGAAAAIEIVGR